MERELKFRAWDSVNKVMELNIHHLDSLNEILHKEKYNVMQFTGLKDKNGKEIYEGDIVRDGDYTMEVIFNNHFASFGLRKTKWMSDHFFQEASNPENCTIIGNIYENPELLK